MIEKDWKYWKEIEKIFFGTKIDQKLKRKVWLKP